MCNIEIGDYVILHRSRNIYYVDEIIKFKGSTYYNLEKSTFNFRVTEDQILIVIKKQEIEGLTRNMLEDKNK